MTALATLAVLVRYYSIDGVRQARRFSTLAGARKFAQRCVGATPEFGRTYAVSADGVGKVMVEGARLADLFPAAVAEMAADCVDAFEAAMQAEAAAERAQDRADADEAAQAARDFYAVRRVAGCTCSDQQLIQVGCDCGAEYAAEARAKPAWPLTARRVQGGRAYDIFESTPAKLAQYPQTVRFARLTAKGVFTCLDSELGEYLQGALRADLDFAGKLAAIRTAYDALNESRARESRAELDAENAWLRAAEAPTNDDLGFAEYEARLGKF